MQTVQKQKTNKELISAAEIPAPLRRWSWNMCKVVKLWVTNISFP